MIDRAARTAAIKSGEALADLESSMRNRAWSELLDAAKLLLREADALIEGKSQSPDWQQQVQSCLTAAMNSARAFQVAKDLDAKKEK